MAVGLICAFLCKEDVALLVLMVGLYLVVFKRDWRWGLPTAVLGFTWAFVVTLWVILDSAAHSYPLKPWETEAEIDDLVADVGYAVVLQGDGIHLFQRGGPALPAIEVDRIVDQTMRLERVEVAPQAEDGFYRPVAQQPLVMNAGQAVRVSLYWQALAALEAERMVSVRIMDASGVLVGQYDGLPGRGKRPTSWWEEGWQIRDVYDLSVSASAQPGVGRMELLVYDTHSGEPLAWDGGTVQVQLCDVVVSQ
jgi:hypothetical protein